MLIETDVVGLPVLVRRAAGPHRAGRAPLPAGRRPGHRRGLAHGRHPGARRVGPARGARRRRPGVAAGPRSARRLGAWSSRRPHPMRPRPRGPRRCRARRHRGCSRSTGGARSRTPTSCSPTASPRWATSRRSRRGPRSSTSASCPDTTRCPRTEIERIMVERALAGLTVVRLKGGDPYVFGRGGEEVAAAVDAGLPVTVVPGVSSAVGVPGAAGIPVTHRGVSHVVTIVSGHVPLDDAAGQGARRPRRHRRRAHGHAQPRADRGRPRALRPRPPTPRLPSSSAASPRTSAASSAPSARCRGSSSGAARPRPPSSSSARWCGSRRCGRAGPAPARSRPSDERRPLPPDPPRGRRS